MSASDHSFLCCIT